MRCRVLAWRCRSETARTERSHATDLAPEKQDQIGRFYLLSYSPQINPEQRLNADLKPELGKRVPVRSKARLREAASGGRLYALTQQFAF